MKKILHLISQAHLDPVWLWPRLDGMAETLTTFQSAVDRLEEFPQFKFTRSSSCSYEWVRDNDPRLFAEIKKHVRSGRWEIVGGWFEQPDCNLPSAASFLRQADFAREFFHAEFGPGALTPCGYNVDSFGHCGGLPRLLRAAGLDAYAFMRPEPWDNPDLPLLFHWETTDGRARVLAVRIPGGYSQSYAATDADLERDLRAAAQKNFAPGMAHGVFWFGVGNHGGGPTREHIAHVLKLAPEFAADPALPELRFSTLREFLAAVRAESAHAALPVVRGELGYVFRGCYAANGETKRRHREAEKSLLTAESLLATSPAPNPIELRPALRRAWRDLLFLQFHDILAGTCVAAAQQEILDRFGSVITTARDIAQTLALTTARAVDTSTERGVVICALNPLPWRRRALVSLDTFVKIHGRDQITGLTAPNGQTIPIQWLPAEANFGPWGLQWGKLCALVDLPACGHTVLSVKTQTIGPEPTKENEPSADTENPQFAHAATNNKTAAPVTIARPGPALPALSREAAHGADILAAPPRLIIVNDIGGTWGHGKKSYDEVLGHAQSEGHEILADGPLLTWLREKFHWGRSEIWMDVLRFTHTNAVELRLRFNWQEHRQQLKLEIPTRLRDTRLLAKMPAETVTRRADGHEYPCHDWVALQGVLDSSPAALVVINDSTYSHCALAGTLRLTLARAAPHAEHPPFEYQDTRHVVFLDQGWQERRFLLIQQTPPLSPGALHRTAEEFQIPPLVIMDNAHPGQLPREQSALELPDHHVAPLCFDVPDDPRSAASIRLWETDGLDTPFRILTGSATTQLSPAPHGIINIPLAINNSPEP